MKRLLLFYTLVSLAACQSKNERSDFQVEPGLVLTRVAQEPLVIDPVDLEFNERGEAWVLEMPGYPMEDHSSRLVILTDTNGDGIYDQRKVFQENLQLANSFMHYKKGVLVAAPPYLLFVHDDNQDYVPERTDTLMGGFSTGNLQHNYNGLRLGLDQWIYAANGGNDGVPYWWNDTTTRVDLRGQDFRFHLQTKQIERLGESSGGFGLAMDDYGRLFETHNLTHISHLVFSDRYVGTQSPFSTLENISDHDDNGLARIYPIGEQESRVNHPEQSGYFSGSCGITYYGGGTLGTPYQETVWVADVVLNLIHVDQLVPNGSSFAAKRLLEGRDMLASSDRAFRPVNMTVGPDGAMYVVDMYRKVIEHPEWIPDEIEKTLDLDAGKDKGRIYRISGTSAAPAFDPKWFDSPTSCVSSLSNSNQWVRLTAHRLLSEDSLTAETIALLRSKLTASENWYRLHSLSLLGAAQLLTEEELVAAISDTDPGIRQAALQLAENRASDTRLLEKCQLALTDPDQRVRLQAALTLSMIRKPAALSTNDDWLQLLQKSVQLPMDRWNIQAIALLAGDDAPALLLSIMKSRENAPVALMEVLAERAAQTAVGLESILRALVSNPQPALTLTLIRHLRTGVQSPMRVDERVIQKLEASKDVRLITELAQLRASLKLPPSAAFLDLSKKALTRIVDRSLPDSVRTQELRLVGLMPYATKASVLYKCLYHSEPIALQEEALRQLAATTQPDIGRQLVQQWNSLSPHIRRYASDLLLYTEAYHDALLDSLETGGINIGEMNFDLERRRMLLWWTDNEETKKRAAALFSDSGVTNRQEAIDKMRPALTIKGSVDNGLQVFERVCSHCHTYGAIGKQVGPALTEIARKSKETLLHDILDPNAAADPQYINHRIETNTGAIHMGIVASETDATVVIKKMGGEEVRISKSDIKSFRSLGTSLMMEGLESSITEQEMADLLAFLQNGPGK